MWKPIAIAALFTAAVCGAFGAALWHGYSPIDDSFLILGNIIVRGPTWEHMRLAFTTFDPELYIPLTLLSFQWDYLIGGLDPQVFHATNLLLHIANALLVVQLLRLMLGRTDVAILGGLLFAVHPLHTEAVVWIAGRKDLLSTFFYLLSFITYIYARRGNNRLLVLSIACFVLALLSKVVAASLPLVLLAYEFLIVREQIDRKNTPAFTPYFLLAAVFALIATFGKERIIGLSDPFTVVLVACKSILFYVWKLVAPFGLSVIYEQTEAVTILRPIFLLAIVCAVALIAVVIRYRRTYPLLSFGLFMYLITLSPTFLNVQKGEYLIYAVDRYAYIPSIGLILAACLALQLLRGKGVVIMGAVLITVLLLISHRQTSLWSTPQTLFAHALQLHPKSSLIRVGLARIKREMGDVEEAFEILREGLLYSNDPQLYLGAGAIYTRTGQLNDAREQFLKAAELDPQSPDPAFALGSMAEQLGQLELAEEYYEQAVALDESFVIARAKLGDLYQARGDSALAREQYEQALAWNPSSVEAHVGLAAVLEEEDPEEALLHVRKALLIDPHHEQALLLEERLGASTAQ